MQKGYRSISSVPILVPDVVMTTVNRLEKAIRGYFLLGIEENFAVCTVKLTQKDTIVPFLNLFVDISTRREEKIVHSESVIEFMKSEFEIERFVPRLKKNVGEGHYIQKSADIVKSTIDLRNS